MHISIIPFAGHLKLVVHLPVLPPVSGLMRTWTISLIQPTKYLLSAYHVLSAKNEKVIKNECSPLPDRA